MITIAILIFVAGLVYAVIRITTPKAPDKAQNYTLDERYNAAKVEKQKEIDRILEKINKKGIASLSSHEKELLDDYSRN